MAVSHPGPVSLIITALCLGFAACGGGGPTTAQTPASPTPASVTAASTQATVVISATPTPLVAVSDPADTGAHYRIDAALTIQETAGKAVQLSRLQVTVTGASGWTAVATQHVSLAVPAKGTVTYGLSTAIDVAGQDTSATWRLETAAVDTEGGAVPVAPVNAALTIVDPPVPDAVLVGAGDIAGCGLASTEATAKLLDAIPGTVFTAGDNVYPVASADAYQRCYQPAWGRHLWRTYPTAGNHDWENSTAIMAYFSYFGQNSNPYLGYYSYNLGAWHIIALNSNVLAGPGSAQYEWLKNDLAANAKTACTLAVWHHPVFSSGPSGGSNQMKQIWQMLVQQGVDVVVNGHDHLYERFAPQDADGHANAKGLRQFTVGTGGYTLYTRARTAANSEVFDSSTWGVIKFTLKRRSYDWEFVPIAGSSFRDAGTSACVVPGS
jgi:acid phosphatase type 7